MIRKLATCVFSIFFSSLTITGLGQDIRIDHVITVVADLDSTVIAFEDLGFTVKKGRLHDNGLLNAHIKFKNHTSFELMSIKGEPSDDLAREYTELLKSGEGGVFLAITGISIEALANKLKGLGIDYNIIPGTNWDYIRFSEKSSLAHIIFIDYHIKITDARETLNHKNLVSHLKSVWIEATDSVSYLMNGIGLKPLGNIMESTLGEGLRYFTESGEIILLSNKNKISRPRIRMVSFTNEEDSEDIKVIF